MQINRKKLTVSVIKLICTICSAINAVAAFFAIGTISGSVIWKEQLLHPLSSVCLEFGTLLVGTALAGFCLYKFRKGLDTLEEEKNLKEEDKTIHKEEFIKKYRIPTFISCVLAVISVWFMYIILI